MTWRRRWGEGYRPEVSTPEPTVGPSGPSGASSGYSGTVPAAELPPPRPVPSANAHRPHPAANAWPDDAVTVTYAELRRLIALHLDLCAQIAPRDRPWTWLDKRARAIRDGEAPLLLSEVMEP